MNIAATIMGALGIVGGLFALYIRLTLSDFIVKTLDERYPNRELMEEKFASLHAAISSLPCRSRGVCNYGTQGGD